MALQSNKIKKILAITAHPDDLELSFGGSVHKWFTQGCMIDNLIGGLKASMGYLGAKTIKDLQRKGEFLKITKAGFYESMVHNVDQVKDNGTK